MNGKVLLLMALALMTTIFWRQADFSSFQILTYEKYLSDLGSSLDIIDPDEIFSYIFSSLPEKVAVYPTENYYYFKFWAEGKEWWGNIRLAEGERDDGILNFAYWEFNNLPEKPDDARYGSYFKKFGPEDGLKVVKKSNLEYEVGWRGRQVLFKLNDLAQIAPSGLSPDEEFLMRTFDESGSQFYLLFNGKIKNFLWVLDESGGAPEDFISIGERIVLGKRTQFIFYDDESYKRKILIGVYAGNIRRNNYFDGPFDQLADNFIKGDGLKRAIEAAYGSAIPRIDNYGFFLDEAGRRTSTRTAITPYRTYEDTEEMTDFVFLCEKKADDDAAIACLVNDGREG
jgi:hypothetical protein